VQGPVELSGGAPHFLAGLPHFAADLHPVAPDFPGSFRACLVGFPPGSRHLPTHFRAVIPRVPPPPAEGWHNQQYQQHSNRHKFHAVAPYSSYIRPPEEKVWPDSRVFSCQGTAKNPGAKDAEQVELKLGRPKAGIGEFR
jgi:hypothetical protein